MSSDVMRVRLHLCRIRVLGVVSDTPFELVVEVESAVRRPRCPECGFGCSRVHDVRVKRVRDLDVSGRATVLLWRRRRLVCDNCDGRFLEEHPAFEGSVTARLARRLVADAGVMPIRQVARRHKIGWHKINALVGAWAAVVAERRRSRACRVLLAGEASMRERRRYVTVIVNADTGRTLAMVPHRTTAALSGFFASQGRKRREQVKVVAADGSPGYRAAVAAHLGHARHVLDRFHAIRWFSAGLTAVRRDVQRGGSQPAGRAFDPQVFKARFALLKRADTLADTDRARLDALFDTHPRLQAAWQALQELRGTLRRRRPPRRPASPRPVLRPLPDRRAPRVPRHREHPHRTLRRDTQLAPHPTALKRTHRRNQQPPPSPQTHRLRLHQPPQLPSPRPADNPTPTDHSNPKPHKNAQ